MKCFSLHGDRWVEHAGALADRAPAAAAAAVAAVAAPALRLIAGDGLPGEVMVPRVVVSLQSLPLHYELYTTSWNLNSGVSDRFRCHLGELPRSFHWPYMCLERDIFVRCCNLLRWWKRKALGYSCIINDAVHSINSLYGQLLSSYLTQPAHCSKAHWLQLCMKGVYMSRSVVCRYQAIYMEKTYQLDSLCVSRLPDWMLRQYLKRGRAWRGCYVFIYRVQWA